MTNGDFVRGLTDDQLTKLIVWREVKSAHLYVPDCSEVCSDFKYGCAVECPKSRQEQFVTDWLKSEYGGDTCE